MRFRMHIAWLLLLMISCSLAAQEWSPYVPGQVSYYKTSNRNYPSIVNRSLDTVIERTSHTVYFFKSYLQDTSYFTSHHCRNFTPPDSLIFNGTYYQYNSVQFVEEDTMFYGMRMINRAQRFYLLDTIGTTWKNFRIRPDNKDTIITTYQIINKKTDTFLSIIDSVKTIQYYDDFYQDTSSFIISKNHGLVGGKLMFPNISYGINFISNRIANHDSLIGITNKNFSKGYQQLNAEHFLPYKVGDKMLISKEVKWPPYHSYEEYIDSITRVSDNGKEIRVWRDRIKYNSSGEKVIMDQLTGSISKDFFNRLLESHSYYIAALRPYQAYLTFEVQTERYGKGEYDVLSYEEIGDSKFSDTCSFQLGIDDDRNYVRVNYSSKTGFKSYYSITVIEYEDYMIENKYVRGYISGNDTFGTFHKVYIGFPEEIIKPSVNLYPTSTNDEISLYAESIIGEIRYQIISLSGKATKRGTFTQQTTINVSNLPKGIYLLELRTDKGQMVKKFIKQ